MTPAEVRALSIAEYMAFLQHMDRERRANERAAKRKGR